MSYRIKNKFAKRRVCGVERLVGFDRRGNLTFRQVVSTLFFCPYLNKKKLTTKNKSTCYRHLIATAE
jgi:hypothetical protein